MDSARDSSADFRFTRERRLLAKKHFETVFKEGRKHVRPSVVVYACPRDPATETESRLGLAVSRKVGKAVVRNRVRRRLKEIFRLNRHLFGCPTDLVVVARHNAGAATFQELRDQILSVFDRINRSVDQSADFKK